MKLRELLEKIRMRPLKNDDEPSLEDVDAQGVDAFTADVGNAPTNWVPSQQDERRRY